MTKSIAKFWIVMYLFVPKYYVKCEDSALATFGTTETESFVDPHSLYYNRNEERIMTEEDFDMIKRDEQNMKDRSRTEHHRHGESCIQFEIFYRRLIKLLLSNTNFEKDGDFIEGVIRIEATSVQIEALREFENKKFSVREIDTILGDIIKKPEYNILNEAVYITENIFQIMREYKEVILAIVVTVLSLLTLKNLRWTPGVIILFTVLAAFLISFTLTYMQLVQEAEIKLAAAQTQFSTIPSACLPEQMSWFEKVSSYFYTNTDCEKYFKAVMTDAKLQVTPALVLTHLFSTVIFHPFTVFGTALSSFIQNSTDKLPAILRWGIISLIFGSVCLVIVVLPVCLITGSFTLSLGPLFTISFGGHRSSRNDRLLGNSKPERIEYIREVPYDISKHTPKAITHEHNNKCCCVKAKECIDSCANSASNKSKLSDFSKDVDKASGDASANITDSKVTDITRKEFDACERKQNEQEVGSGDG